MLDELKHRVCQAGLAMSAGALAFRGWGSVSAIDRDAERMVITPAGGAGAASGPGDLAVLDLAGEPVGDSAQPSGGAAMHLAIYRRMTGPAALAFSAGAFATAWAQARKSIPVLGTTHAEFTPGPVACTRPLSDEQLASGYHDAVAVAIAEAAAELPDGPAPGVLVANMGLVTFGNCPAEAVGRAEIIEHIARLARLTIEIEPYPRGISREMLARCTARPRGQAGGATKN